MIEPGIQIDGLTHDYGRTRALVDVSLRVAPCEVVGLIGPNGAGKTTLMRAIATLLSPTAGRARVAGHDAIHDAPAVRRAVGYLPERAALYPDLRAWECLDFFAEIAGHDAPGRARRIDEALARAGLAERRDALTRELSKGLRQRLALQATLLHDPTALVLDEPTDGLDPESRDDVLRDVRGLADAGRAVLLSSHVLDEVEQVADRVVILVDGRVTDEKGPASRRFVVRVRAGGSAAGPDDAEAARAIVAARADVRAVAVQGGRLVVDLAPGVEDASGVAAALVGAGFALVEVREERDTLRDRFRRAVKGDAS